MLDWEKFAIPLCICACGGRSPSTQDCSDGRHLFAGQDSDVSSVCQIVMGKFNANPDTRLNPVATDFVGTKTHNLAITCH